jgi:hypothetical protein
VGSIHGLNIARAFACALLRYRGRQTIADLNETQQIFLTRLRQRCSVAIAGLTHDRDVAGAGLCDRERIVRACLIGPRPIARAALVNVCACAAAVMVVFDLIAPPDVGARFLRV